MPHKAASFNTVKRAKITIVGIIFFSISYNLPYLFITSSKGRVCVSYVNNDIFYVQVYYWSSLTISFILPFVTLLTMNSVIIHTLRQRSKLTKTMRSEVQGQKDRQSAKAKASERQIYTMLLLVTFGFLTLTTPIDAMAFYTTFFPGSSPKFHADFHLFYHISEKLYYTNHGINFFLYVMSGQKFRKDLIKLFCKKKRKESSTTSLPDNPNSAVSPSTINTGK